jgi:manganese transport protein
MEGYLRLRMNPWIRRLLTRLIAIVPAVIVILINGEENIDDLLIFSQVILSLQLGFAVIPLIHFVSNKKKMGAFAIKPFVQVLAWLITIVLVYLNIRMISGQAVEFFAESESVFWKALIIVGGLAFAALLLIAVVYPLLNGKTQDRAMALHTPETIQIGEPLFPRYDCIAIALDLSMRDKEVIAHAMGHAGAGTRFVLIHIVESASAKILGHQTEDLETVKDRETLEGYVAQMEQKGFKAEAALGFSNRNKEIAKLVTDSGAELLVIGAHGHSGMKDWFYGETINAVRHQLKIPVLIVSV